MPRLAHSSRSSAHKPQCINRISRLDAFRQQALEEALAHLSKMEEANLDVMRIVAALIPEHEGDAQPVPARVAKRSRCLVGTRVMLAS